MNDSERRVARRASRPIEVRFMCEETSHQGRIEDLSETGAFISATQLWPTGAPLQLSFQLPDGLSDTPIEASGEVVWSERVGFGVRFEGLDTATRDRIRFFVESELFGSGRLAGVEGSF